MENADKGDSSERLRSLFVGECLEAWKFEYLFCHRLKILKETGVSVRIRSMAGYVNQIVEGHLQILDRFIPDIEQTLEDAAPIYRTATFHTDRHFTDLFPSEGHFEQQAIKYLIGILSQCQRTYQSLAQEAVRFGFPGAGTLLEAGSNDYKTLVDRWSAPS